jgi:hypothetical protein
MFDPEFKYLLIEEAENRGELIQNLDNHIWAAILVCSLNLLILSPFIYISWQLIVKLGFYIQLICEYLWNFLTPRNRLLELLAISTTILCLILMNYTFYEINNQINKKFIKLKKDLKNKDKIIKQLENQLKINQEEEYRNDKNNSGILAFKA